MEKNGRIKKIGCLGAYSFVLFLFAFDCLYFWVSQKRQVVHYNKLTECFYGKHVTYLSGVYLWAYIFFILMPVVFFIFWKKKIRTVVLFALLFVLHVAVGTSFVIWLESMDNDGTYDGFGVSTVMNSKSQVGIGYYVYRKCMFLVQIQRKASNITLFMSKQDTIL